MNTEKMRGLAVSIKGGKHTPHVLHLIDDAVAAANRIDQMDYAIKEAINFCKNAMQYGALKHDVDVQKIEYVLDLLQRAENI